MSVPTFDEAKTAMRTANFRLYGKPPFVEARSMIGKGLFLIVTTNKDDYDLPWRALRLGLEKGDPAEPKQDMSFCVRIVDIHGRESWIGRTASVLPIPESPPDA